MTKNAPDPLDRFVMRPEDVEILRVGPEPSEAPSKLGAMTDAKRAGKLADLIELMDEVLIGAEDADEVSPNLIKLHQERERARGYLQEGVLGSADFDEWLGRIKSITEQLAT